MGENGYWEKQAKRYHRAALILNARFPQMTQAVGDALRGDDEVLEVAAGTGMVTAAVAPRARRYVATDQTPEMLAVLSQALGDLQNLETRVADALALDFPDASFDAVVMANLLHLLSEPGRALAEARRVLRPRGRLIAPTFCHGEGALARCVSHILVTTGFPVVTRFRGDDLQDLVATARFVVIGTHWHRGLLPIRFVAARRL